MSILAVARPQAPWNLYAIALLAGLTAIAAYGTTFLPDAASMNRDTLWLIEVCERLLNGAVLYRDVLETNPPMSVLLYLLPVALAQWLGIASETAVLVYTLGFAALSTWLCLVVMRQAAMLDAQRRLIAGFGLFVLMALMPKQVLTQREHFAGMAILPFLVLLMMRLDRMQRPALWLTILCGIGAGLCVAIKPHFMLALGFPLLLLAASRRDVRLLFGIEVMAAAFVSVAYLLLVLASFPDYGRTMLPLLLETYVAGKTALIPYLFSPLTLVFLALPVLVLLILPHPRRDLRPWVLMAAALGFFIAYLLQGKGWVYHLYPAVLVCGAAALFVSLCQSGTASPALRTTLTLPLIATFLLFFFMGAPSRYDRLEAALQPLPEGAPVLIVTSDLGVNFPAIRKKNLRWVSRVCSQWLATAAIMRLAEPGLGADQHDAMHKALSVERQWLLDDIKAGKPDMIVFDIRPGFDWQKFAFDDPALSAELASYRFERVFDDADGFRFSLFRRITTAAVLLPEPEEP